MPGRPGGDRNLCWLGRLAQRAGCLPDRSTTNAQVFYPISIRPAFNGYGYDYSNDIKFKPLPRLPPPQPEQPKPQTNTYAVAYRPLHAPEAPRKTPRKTPKKTPIAQTIPLSTLPLPVNALPGCTPAAACVHPRVEPPVMPPVHFDHTPRAPPPPVISQTPYQNVIPNSIFQDLVNITPTQYVWDAPQGTLIYTPAPTSTLLPPNVLPNTGVCPSRTIDPGGGSDEPIGLGVIPSPILSGTPDLPSDRMIFDRCSGITLNPLLEPNYFLPHEAKIRWDVSEPVDKARHVLDDARFIAGVNGLATNPPTTTLRIEFHFIDDPGTQWNWEPITIRKPLPIRVADIFHAIHDYFQTQLTHAEYDIIKSHGRSNARIVKDSWRGRVDSQPEEVARSLVHHGGLTRVDCLGSSKKFAGLWVDGSSLKLGLHA